MRKRLNFYEVAARFDVCAAAIYKWQCKGWLPKPHKLGGRMFYFQDELETWEAEGCPRQADAKQEDEVKI